MHRPKGWDPKVRASTLHYAAWMAEQLQKEIGGVWRARVYVDTSGGFIDYTPEAWSGQRRVYVYAMRFGANTVKYKAVVADLEGLDTQGVTPVTAFSKLKKNIDRHISILSEAVDASRF